MLIAVPRPGVAVGPSVESPVKSGFLAYKATFRGKGAALGENLLSFRGSFSMVRAIFGLGLVAVFIGLAGCTMCCHCDDRCGPVYDHGCQTCCPSARAGSILEGGGRQAAGDTDLSANRNL